MPIRNILYDTFEKIKDDTRSDIVIIGNILIIVITKGFRKNSFLSSTHLNNASGL